MLRRLLGMAVITAAPLVALLVYHHVDEYRRLDAATHAEAIERSQAITSEYDRLLTGAQHLLLAVSRRGSIRTRDPDACRVALVDLVAELQSYAALAAYDLSGRPLCASYALLPNENAAGRPFFRRALSSGGFSLGNALRNRSNGRLQLPAAMPFTGVDGQIAGIVMLLIDLEWINRIIDALGSGGTNVVVADGDGTVIMTSPPPRDTSGRPLYPPLPPKLHEKLGASKAGTVIAPGHDELQRIWGYSPLGAAPKDLFVAAGIDEQAARNTVLHAIVQSVLTSIAFLTLAIAVGVLAGWRLLRRPVMTAMTSDIAQPEETPGSALVTRLPRVAQGAAVGDRPRG